MAKMKLLELWMSSLLSLPSAKLKGSRRVEGVWDRHLGPRREFAKIVFLIEPSDKFEVSIQSTNELGELSKIGYLDWGVMGLLDVIMVSGTLPLKDIKVTITDAWSDPTDSNHMAFRHAGRVAGRSLMALI